MTQPSQIPFQELLDALLDADSPLPTRFLYRLSDLDKNELARLRQTWPNVPAWRRKALLEDVEALGTHDYLLSFEQLALFATEDPDPSVRLPATRTLGEYESPELAGVFLELLRKDESAAVRAAAATGLGYYVYLGELEELDQDFFREIEDSLLAATQGEDEAQVRREALESLGYSSREEVSSLIEAAYNSGIREWIASALYAMGRSANEEWGPQVLAMLDNPFPIVRTEAARAAGELEISKAVSALIEMLDDPNDDARRAAIWSLSQLGGEGVRDILEALYDKTDDEDTAEFIDNALDNLAFTEDMQLMPMFDIDEEMSDDDELYELDELDDLNEDEEDLEQSDDIADLEDDEI